MNGTAHILTISGSILEIWTTLALEYAKTILIKIVAEKFLVLGILEVWE